MTSGFDVVTVGNYTKDTIVTRSGTRHVHGGGFNYAAHAARVRGLEVGAVTRLAQEDEEAVRLLEAAGVTVFPRFTRSSTIMRLEYPTDNVDQRVLTVAETAGAVEVDQVSGLESRAFLVSPSIRGEVPLETVVAMRRPGVLLGLDLQGYIRIRREDGTLAHSDWPEAREVLQHVDILKSDAVEAESLTGETDHRAAARALAALGPHEILLTHRDGIVVLAEGRFYEVPFRPRELRGRSGRGDTCLGSFLSRRLDGSPRDAIHWAAALTSLKLEAEGAIRRTRDEVDADLARYEVRVSAG
jgi:sugar/nucleoside kinase (ribokinase family)